MKTQFKNIKLTSNFLGNKKFDATTNNYNNHKICVYNTINNKRIYFDFWASVNNPEIREEYELLEALNCFLSDATSANQSFEEFCSEFGYNDDSIRSLHTYKACKNLLKKALKIFATESNLYEFHNELLENL